MKPLRIALLLVLGLALSTPRDFLFAQSGGLAPSKDNGALDGSNNAQPSQRSLEEIEPRIPITAIPFTISQPGSYYLTGPLASATDGIIVNTDDVTIDLNGFTMTGTGTLGTDRGIDIGGATVQSLENVRVRNGVIRGFGTSVYLQNTRHCRVIDLACTGPASKGIEIAAVQGTHRAVGNVIRRCRVDGGLVGMILLPTGGGACEGNRISDCVVVNAANQGIYLQPLTSGSQCDGNHIERCAVDGCGVGISLRTVEGGTSCHANAVVNCVVRNITGRGIEINGLNGDARGNVLVDNAVLDVMERGISLISSSGNRVESNRISRVTATANADGINVFSADPANRISQNFVSGIVATNNVNRAINASAADFIFKNMAGGTLTTYSLGSGNTFGPEVFTAGALANTGNDSHPWANFLR